MEFPSLTRRRFIRTVAGGTFGGMALYAFPELTRAKYVVAGGQQIEAEDEEFSGVVRAQFPPVPEPVYLNNGTMGPSPYVVIDAVRREMDAVDRTGRYGGGKSYGPGLRGSSMRLRRRWRSPTMVPRGSTLWSTASRSSAATRSFAPRTSMPGTPSPGWPVPVETALCSELSRRGKRRMKR